MAKKDDGGPAFPVQVRRDEKYMDEGGYGRVRSFLITEGGLSIRDVFAKDAMRVLAYDWQKEVAEGIYNNFAQDCYYWPTQ